MSVLQTIKNLIDGSEKEEVVACQSDIEDDYDYDYDDFIGDDEWEDGPAVERIMAELGPGWYVVKVTNFTENTLADIDEWCKANCQAPFKEVGWDSGCSYTVAVALSNHTDAVMFKLTWGS